MPTKLKRLFTNNFIKSLILVSLVTSSCEATLFVGADIDGYLNSNAENSKFEITDFSLDMEGNLYLAEGLNKVIRKITPNGEVSTFAGSGKLGETLGKKEEVYFNRPETVKVHPSGKIYVIDTLKNTESSGKLKMIDTDGIVKSIDFKNNDNLGTAEDLHIDSQGNIYLKFSSGVYKMSNDSELEKINTDSLKLLTYVGLIGFDKVKKTLYFSSETPSNGGDIFLGFPPGEVSIHSINIETNQYEEITNKFSNPPYPKGTRPINIISDDEGNLYIFHLGGTVSKTSKEGKFIKNYSTSYFQILPFSINPIRMGNIKSGRMAIDSKRQILYLSNYNSIYKINLKD